MQGMKGRSRALLLALVLLAGCELLADDLPSERASLAPAAARPVVVATRAPTAPPTRPPRTATPVSATPSPAVSPTTMATPDSRPTTTIALGTPPAQQPASASYRRYASALHPYAIDYPEQWHSISGGATADEAKADLFVGGQHGKVTSSITVYSQPMAEDTSSRFLLDAVMAGLVEAGITPGDEQARAIAGAEAFVFNYSTTSHEQEYAVIQATFVHNDRGWMVTLTCAPSEVDRLRPRFDHMLNSLQTWS